MNLKTFLNKNLACMKNKIINYKIIWYPFLLLLIIANIISKNNNISKYNGYILLIFSIILALIDKNNRELLNIIFISALILTSGIFFSSPIFYILIDCTTIFFILTSLDIGCKCRVSKNCARQLYYTGIIILFLSILFSFNSNYYHLTNENIVRYSGIFRATNFSANIFAIIEICVWELYKYIHKDCLSIKPLIILIIILIYYTDLSGTRSLLFCYPYWFYQFYLNLDALKYKHIIVTVFAIIIILLIPLILSLIKTKLRFEEGEKSLATRAVLYDQLISGIITNNCFIPHGSHSAQIMIEKVTDNDTFSPHNSFLAYMYDWGIIFIMLLYTLYSRLRKSGLININMCLIFLAFSSFALHNMLFSIYLWIPLVVVLIVNNEYSKKISSFSYRA